MRQLFFITAFIFASVTTWAQGPQNLEKIIGIVGDRIVLNSDVETAYEDAKKQTPDLPESTKCEILEQTLGQKILAEQADRDSVEIGNEELEGYLDNRIRSFVQHYGSEKKLEQVAGKTVYQLKDEYRPVFKEQLKAQRMQQQLMSKVKITPQEVKAFYNAMPQDSLPFYPSMVEIGQIVFAPIISKEVDDYAKNKLQKIRDEIEKGEKTFDVQAGIYSEDPGTRDQGGDMGFVKREQLVPEFAAAAFRLQTGELSKVIKSEYGYHIIEMIERQGENARLRHILIKPIVTSGDVKISEKKADSVRAELMAGKISFGEAVKEYSSDKQSKSTGGMIVNPYTGSSFLEMKQLDAGAAIALQDLKEGEYSKPAEYKTPAGDKTVRIIYLRTRTEPHKANLKDDYNKIQEVALAKKQNEYLFNWLAQRIPSFYVKIDKKYQDCPNISKWLQSAQIKK